MERCCENCGRKACANSIIAVLYDYCVKDGFTKYWLPKEEKKDDDETGD